MAATPLYKTPDGYKDSFGTFNDPLLRLLAEIYNQLYNGGSVIIANATNMLITAADFNPSDEYTNPLLMGKTPGTTMLVYVNVGNGVAATGTIVNEGDGYTFDSVTGTITATPDNYLIQVFQ